MMLWRIRRLFLIKELYNLTIHHEELRLQHISLESLLAGMVQCRTSSVGDVNTFGFSTAYWNTVRHNGGHVADNSLQSRITPCS